MRNLLCKRIAFIVVMVLALTSMPVNILNLVAESPAPTQLPTPIISIYQLGNGTKTLNVQWSDIIPDYVLSDMRIRRIINGQDQGLGTSVDDVLSQITFQPGNEYQIQIGFVSQHPDWLDSELSNIVTWQMPQDSLPAPVISLAGSVLSWNAIDGVNFYAIYINGEHAALIYGTNVDLLGIYEFYHGVFQIYVIATTTAPTTPGAFSSE